MPSKDKDQIQLLQGMLDLVVLRTLATMGSQLRMKEQQTSSISRSIKPPSPKETSPAPEK